MVFPVNSNEPGVLQNNKNCSAAHHEASEFFFQSWPNALAPSSTSSHHTPPLGPKFSNTRGSFTSAFVANCCLLTFISMKLIISYGSRLSARNKTADVTDFRKLTTRRANNCSCYLLAAGLGLSLHSVFCEYPLYGLLFRTLFFQ